MSTKLKLAVLITAIFLGGLAFGATAKAASYVDVSLDQNQPRNISLTPSSTNVVLLILNVTNAANSTEAVNLTSLGLKNNAVRGVLASNFLANISLYIGDNLIATKSPTGQNFNFTNLNINIPTSTTRVLTIKGTVNTNKAKDIINKSPDDEVIINMRLGVDGAANVRALGSVTRQRSQVRGSFPVLGNAFYLYYVKSVIDYSISENTPRAAFISATSTNASLAIYNFQNTGWNGTVVISKLRLRNVGTSANRSRTLSRIHLYDGDRLLASKSAPGRFYDFSNLNLLIPAGQTKNITVKVDMGRSATRGETVIIDFDNSNFKVYNQDGYLAYPDHPGPYMGNAFTIN